MAVQKVSILAAILVWIPNKYSLKEDHEWNICYILTYTINKTIFKHKLILKNQKSKQTKNTKKGKNKNKIKYIYQSTLVC